MCAAPLLPVDFAEQLPFHTCLYWPHAVPGSLSSLYVLRLVKKPKSVQISGISNPKIHGSKLKQLISAVKRGFPTHILPSVQVLPWGIIGLCGFFHNFFMHIYRQIFIVCHPFLSTHCFSPVFSSVKK